MQTVSLILNFVIFALTFITLARMLTGGFGEKDKSVGIFKYFTTDSNILMGLAALTYALQMLPVLSGKSGAVPYWCVILKLTASAAVALTFITVVVFLAPTCKEGYLDMFKRSGFYYHLVIPLLSIADFALMPDSPEIPLVHTLIGIIPSVLYAIIYSVNVFSHAENGKVSGKYDWYGFVSAGTKFALPAAIIVIGCNYLLTLFLRLIR